MTKEQAIMYIRSMQGICSPQDRMAKEAVRMAIEALSEPSIVRCKDCKSSRVYDGKTTQWLACEDVMEGQATDPNGYCYLGERKEP